MRCYPLALTAICAGCVLIPATARSQPALANQLAELVALKDKVGQSETRIRVEATHRVWAIGVESPDLQVKLSALGLLAEPVRSSSDHIRMPAVYAIADIANSCDDSSVKIRALATLAEPLQAARCQSVMWRLTP
jgi:hypothetical protein